ncbi:THAP domain-containing protein 3 [Trichonephila clavipes]|nr:THAP domain-containing protein 3 [Trichonephila clavipes]
MSHCAAYGCTNYRKKEECKSKSFFKFPVKKPGLLKAWLKMIRRENFKPSAHSLICSDHFEETCFEYQPFTNRRQLKRGSIPTIFVFKKKASSRRILDRCKPSTSVIFLQIEDDLSMGTKRRPIDRYFLFLVKLRTGISNEFLAILFGISDSTVSHDFNFVTDVLYEIKIAGCLPSKGSDCTEIEVQKPSSPMEQQMTFSRYKNANIFKGMIGITLTEL